MARLSTAATISAQDATPVQIRHPILFISLTQENIAAHLENQRVLWMHQH
jgi:hypothetical protein